MTVSEGSRSAFVTICARNDTEVLWNDGENDDFEIHNATSSEACGARDQLVMTSSIFKRTSGAHEFKVELVSTSCETEERPTLSATCECGDITSGAVACFPFSLLTCITIEGAILLCKSYSACLTIHVLCICFILFSCLNHYII